VEEGLSNKEIGGRLGIEVSTVKNHMHNVLGKIDVTRRGQAVSWLRSQAVGAREEAIRKN
jgi:DNA-binding CsgD family transcriptional regulator